MKRKSESDKMYYIFGAVNDDVETFRNKINYITYKKDGKRNIKKYEILNALVTIGLKHKEEVLIQLGLSDFPPTGY